MLLDRKKINRIARWFAIVLAIIFALSGIFLGVGSKTGNIFAGCAKSTSNISASSSFEERERYYLDLIQQNPQDKDSMLQLASLYASEGVGRYNDAINWFNKYLELDPKNVDVRIRIGSIYLNKLSDAASAVKVLTEATAIAPDNANAFLQLGLAAKTAGQNQTAILAWTKYLELDPNSSYASQIKDELAKLATQPATTPTTAAEPGSASNEGAAAPSPVAPAPAP